MVDKDENTWWAAVILAFILITIFMLCVVKSVAETDEPNLEACRFWVNDGSDVVGLGDYSIVTDQETGIQYLMVGDDISPLYDKDGKPMQVTE